MTGQVRKLLLWSPRVLGILAAFFLAVFVLGAVGEGLSAFLLHAAPAVLVSLVVAVSWRWEWVGGSVFIALAVLYGAPSLARGAYWSLAISGPLLAAGVLFLWSWHHRKELHAHS